MGNTHYLSDEQEQLVLYAIETLEIIEGDNGNEEKSKKYGEIYEKIAKKR